MYQVIMKIFSNGKRDVDSISSNIYLKRGWAERAAKRLTVKNGAFERKCYVRGLLRPVTMDEAKSAYCKSKNVWVDGTYGQEKLMSSGCYGSHAPAEELFHRSVGYGYKGGYYLEDED